MPTIIIIMWPDVYPSMLEIHPKNAIKSPSFPNYFLPKNSV